MGRVRLPAPDAAAAGGALDGWFPIGMDEPEQLADQLDVVRELRGDDDGAFEVVVRGEPGGDPAPWADAGATWWLTGFGPTPRADSVRAVISDGPAV